jgi:hypothetical protein
MIDIAIIITIDEEVDGELTKSAQRFLGKEVNVTIPEVNENKLERGADILVSPVRKKGYDHEP